MCFTQSHQEGGSYQKCCFAVSHTDYDAIVQCYKFATDQQADLKKVEALNNHFFRLMSGGPDAPGATSDKSFVCHQFLTVFCCG